MSARITLGRKVLVLLILTILAVAGVTLVLYLRGQETSPRGAPPASLVAQVERWVARDYGPDVTYELVSWTDREAQADVYLRGPSSPVRFATINFMEEKEEWQVRGLSVWPAPSPAKRLVIEGYQLHWSEVNGTTVLSSISSITIRNPERWPAFVWTVDVKIRNASLTYRKTCAAFSLGQVGLIGPDQTKTLACGGPPYPGWYTDGSAFMLPKDRLMQKTFTITLTVKDGQDQVLAEASFVQTF